MVSMWQIVSLPLLEAIAVGALCGLVGALALLHKRIFFAESITHAAFPGAVVGVVVTTWLVSDHFWLSVGLFVGAAVGGVLLALFMHAVAAVSGISAQAAAGITLTLGFSAGYFLDKWFAPLPLKIESFLTGSLLACSKVDVWASVGTLLFAALLWCFGKRSLVGSAFDPVGFRASGGQVGIWSFVVNALLIATVTVIIPAVGMVVSISLLAGPAAALKTKFSSTGTYVLASTLSGVVVSVAGLGLAVWQALSAGGCIALVAGIFFIVVEGGWRLWRVGAASVVDSKGARRFGSRCLPSQDV
ncbi:ABC 3 transport family protein [Winkia neuii]|uniref:metal ABC transporter permease n=1 Tax=Winkia neuii TaxID=33007 RepID=UPI000795E54C|nr:metal ABC transporter permease [Winkia neuii]KWZ72647.1 ABC 3 transport family protein [Winkia neuii]